jgi:hypothetical protein
MMPVVLVPVVVPVVPVVVLVVVPVVPVVLVPVVACPHAGNANTKRKAMAANIVRKYGMSFPCSFSITPTVDNSLSEQTTQ